MWNINAESIYIQIALLNEQALADLESMMLDSEDINVSSLVDALRSNTRKKDV